MPRTFQDGKAAVSPPHRLLLLAAKGEPWGLAASGAAEAAGFEVERLSSAGELLQVLGGNGARPGWEPLEAGGEDRPGAGAPPADEEEEEVDDEEGSPRGGTGRSPAAILAVGHGLLAADRAVRQRLATRSRQLGLPLVVLAEEGQAELFAEEDLPAHNHVTLVAAPPSERVLTAVLQGVRGERERRQRLRHLQERLERLRSAGQREERLLARVGHELRNPLAVITTTLTLLRDQQQDERSRRYCRVIDRQVALLHQAVDHLLDMTGIEATPLSDDLEPWERPRTDGGGSAPNGDGGDRRQDAEGTADRGAGAGAGTERRPSRQGSEAASSGSGRILLVEDDPDGRAALCDLMEMWGYEVTAAREGEAGAALAEERRPSVALVDIDLPGINGYEVARRIRARYPEAPPLLVAMTGFGQPEDRQRALAAGFDVHLVKPVRPNRLEELLRHPDEALSGAPGAPADA